MAETFCPEGPAAVSATKSQRARNRVAALTRHEHPADSPEVIAAKRDLAESNLESAIRRVVATAPPLTAEQRNRLASLLMTVGDA